MFRPKVVLAVGCIVSLDFDMDILDEDRRVVRAELIVRRSVM